MQSASAKPPSAICEFLPMLNSPPPDFRTVLRIKGKLADRVKISGLRDLDHDFGGGGAQRSSNAMNLSLPSEEPPSTASVWPVVIAPSSEAK